ncbi:MAG: ATP-grasp domain-containing protein [Oligoflexales bacterium]
MWQVLDDFDKNLNNLDADLLAKCENIFYVRSFDSIEEIASIASSLISENVKIEHVVSNGEYSIYGSAVLKSILGLEGNAVLKGLCYRDKRAMKQKLRKNQIRTARYVSVSNIHDIHDLYDKALQIGFPVVVKPANGVGTRLTAVLRNANELNEFHQRVIAEIKPPIFSSQFIVEEYIKGQEFHVDGVWAEGRNICFSAGRYHAPCVEFKEKFYGSMLLDEKNDEHCLKELFELNKNVNRALGICDGPTHLEVFLDCNGEFVVSEMATRIGGGFIMEANLEKDNTCFRSNHVKVLVNPRNFSKSEPPPSQLKVRYFGFINLTPKEEGVITSIPSIDSLKSHPGILRFQLRANIGDSFKHSHGGNWILMVVIAAPSEEEYQMLCKEIIEKFIIQTVPFISKVTN